ncbi:MAG: restriction system-associated AAA family ATPase [Bacteroidia bacterium]|nr:restriction system-associated AAA family ATPase [Bacteroidia bacterium]
MKILRVKIIEISHRPLLNGLELAFTHNDEEQFMYPNILIGTNGSGKSQLLETFAEIFLYLDRLYRKINRTIVSQSPLLFEIDYQIIKDKKDYIVSIKQINKAFKAPEINICDLEGNDVEFTIDDINGYLPQKIIGYTSGDNETLSLPFTDYYDEYAKYTGNRALEEKYKRTKDYDPRFYLMDYNTNIGVLVSNLTLGNPESVKKITKYVGIDSLMSFQIVIQTNHSAAPSKNGVELTKELDLWIKQLSKAATCSEYFPKENKYVLDFFINKETIKAINHFFKTPINFYTALYKIELLNNLIIKDAQLKDIKKQRALRKLIIKPPTVPDQDKVLRYSEVKLKLKSGDIVDYINLSDGEHQFLNIFGTILMTDFDNSLYLLDEPETHFNPKWRREFISLLSEITMGRKQDCFLTSHSPFIVADSRRDKVYLFRRSENNSLVVQWPVEETYGSDFDYILKVAFDLESSLSKKSYDEIQDLIKSKDIDLIKKKIEEFGDSAEKLFLFKRLEELKAAKK